MEVNMAGADDVILAGSRPQHSNPIDALHGRTSFVFVVDSLIITYFLFLILGTLAIIPGLFFLSVWSGYKNRSAWAYWFVPIIIGGLTVIFSLLLLINAYSFFTGNIGGLIFALILGYAVFSSVRFVRIHFHPVYKMGYSGHSIYDESHNLPVGEMLAACPTCLAVLAVNPLLLSPKDKCPHCDSPLVSGFEEE
tara:strand:+ start:91 stop:672 length:582 start_codon:yes stop_codon:yes gene_type:complete